VINRIEENNIGKQQQLEPTLDLLEADLRMVLKGMKERSRRRRQL
jgi:hypothetical protein